MARRLKLDREVSAVGRVGGETGQPLKSSSRAYLAQFITQNAENKLRSSLFFINTPGNQPGPLDPRSSGWFTPLQLGQDDDLDLDPA